MNKDILKIMKALADPTRLQIVQVLANHPEETCQNLIGQFGLSQPTMSHHFNKLVDAGVLNSRKEAVLWFYSLNRPYLESLGFDVAKLSQALEK